MQLSSVILNLLTSDQNKTFTLDDCLASFFNGGNALHILAGNPDALPGLNALWRKSSPDDRARMRSAMTSVFTPTETSGQCPATAKPLCLEKMVVYGEWNTDLRETPDTAEAPDTETSVKCVYDYATFNKAILDEDSVPVSFANTQWATYFYLLPENIQQVLAYKETTHGETRLSPDRVSYDDVQHAAGVNQFGGASLSQAFDLSDYVGTMPLAFLLVNSEGQALAREMFEDLQGEHVNVIIAALNAPAPIENRNENEESVTGWTCLLETETGFSLFLSWFSSPVFREAYQESEQQTLIDNAELLVKRFRRLQRADPAKHDEVTGILREQFSAVMQAVDAVPVAGRGPQFFAQQAVNRKQVGGPTTTRRQERNF